MIRINFSEPNTQDWHDWRRKCATEQRALNEAIAHGQRRKLKRNLYRAKGYEFRHELYLSKNGPFRGKCAYCEQEIYGDQHVDMEHFRPHSSVRDLYWTRVRVVIDGVEVDHPGYYWLAYDWKNLLPACVLCNQQCTDRSSGRRIGKMDRFPVRGSYAVRTGEEETEEPLLIHPVLEDPEQHLRLNDVFAFQGLDDRGDACIQVFGLNDRDLPNARMEVYRNVRQQVGLFLLARNQADLRKQCPSLLQKLLRRKNGCGAHTAAARKAIRDAFADAETQKQEILDERASIQ